MGAQPEQWQPRSATGVRKRLFGCQRLDKLEYSGPDERRIDSYRRCRQRFSMDQGGRRRPRRRCVVWLEPARRPQPPVWASLERLYLSTRISHTLPRAPPPRASPPYPPASYPPPPPPPRPPPPPPPPPPPHPPP